VIRELARSSARRRRRAVHPSSHLRLDFARQALERRLARIILVRLRVLLARLILVVLVVVSRGGGLDSNVIVETSRRLVVLVRVSRAHLRLPRGGSRAVVLTSSLAASREPRARVTSASSSHRVSDGYDE
jgi:hypothetical protein